MYIFKPDISSGINTVPNLEVNIKYSVQPPKQQSPAPACKSSLSIFIDWPPAIPAEDDSVCSEDGRETHLLGNAKKKKIGDGRLSSSVLLKQPQLPKS